MSSKALPTGRHVVAARGLLQMTQDDLARASGVSLRTIIDFETEQRQPRKDTLAALREALEQRGIEFLNSGRPGVRLHPDRTVIPV